MVPHPLVPWPGLLRATTAALLGVATQRLDHPNNCSHVGSLELETLCATCAHQRSASGTGGPPWTVFVTTLGPRSAHASMRRWANSLQEHREDEIALYCSSPAEMYDRAVAQEFHDKFHRWSSFMQSSSPNWYSVSTNCDCFKPRGLTLRNTSQIPRRGNQWRLWFRANHGVMGPWKTTRMAWIFSGSIEIHWLWPPSAQRCRHPLLKCPEKYIESPRPVVFLPVFGRSGGVKGMCIPNRWPLRPCTAAMACTPMGDISNLDGS